eukprot:TRINITY_DN24152_c1_g1_i1.p2 TRINITY_DN24152_c1_g1~~TRINITY_DN24152_c1_g1_i1.p2  ORF type:complete len:156 (+),score=8.84 TRINITY_DN24152_c1_g1_i1:32-499(+)
MAWKKLGGDCVGCFDLVNGTEKNKWVRARGNWKKKGWVRICCNRHIKVGCPVRLLQKNGTRCKSERNETGGTLVIRGGPVGYDHLRVPRYRCPDRVQQAGREARVRLPTRGRPASWRQRRVGDRLHGPVRQGVREPGVPGQAVWSVCSWEVVGGC